ncbi:MAG: hypothetical protein WCO56_27300 [Verrucomicrobiota bacterium]
MRIRGKICIGDCIVLLEFHLCGNIKHRPERVFSRVSVGIRDWITFLDWINIIESNTGTNAVYETGQLASMKLGYIGSTGGVVSYHELQNVFINATVGIPWDNNSGDSRWNTASNWHLDGVPVAGAEIVFENTYVQSAQTIDFGRRTDRARRLVLC